MPQDKPDDKLFWLENMGQHPHQIKSVGWWAFLVMFLFVIIGIIWLYFRLLACQTSIDQEICRWSSTVPLVFVALLIALFIGLHLVLGNYGFDAKLKNKLRVALLRQNLEDFEHDQSFADVEPELIDLIRSFIQERDYNRFEDRLRRSKYYEFRRPGRLRHYALIGYTELPDESHKGHARRTVLFTGIAVGSVVGYLSFYFFKIPALAATFIVLIFIFSALFYFKKP